MNSQRGILGLSKIVILPICLFAISVLLAGCPPPQEPPYPDPGVPGLVHFGNHY